MLKTINNNKYILLILIAGFLLRIIGINHGFPFIFHPDEPTVVRSALGVRFTPNPAHFDWPHFYIYFNYFLYMAFAFIRKFFSSEIFSFLYNDDFIFYTLTRISSSIFGTLTILVTYFMGKELFNKKVGLLSALVLCFLPLHVQYSHYSLTEAPMLFFLSLAVLFSIKILNSKEIFTNTLSYKNSKNFILSGFFIGLAASTKYNAGILAFIVPLASFLAILRYKNFKNYIEFIKDFINIKYFSYFSISGVFAILGFLLGTPYALLDFETFTRTDGPKGALWQFTNVGSTSFTDQIYTFINNIFYQLPKNTGYTVFWLYLILIFASLSFFIIKKSKFNTIKKEEQLKLIFINLPSVLIIWYMSGFEKSRSHYFMVVYPFLVLSFGYFLNIIVTKFNNIFTKILSVFFIIVPAIFSILMTYSFYSTDNRVSFYNYINNSSNINLDKTFIYDYNILKDVFTKSEASNYTKGYDKLDNFDNGYIVVTEDIKNLPSNFDYTLIESFDNKFARGDFIYLFKFTKNNK